MITPSSAPRYPRTGIHGRVAAYFGTQWTGARTARELAFHLYHAGEWEDLARVLTHVPTFLHLCRGETQYEMLAYWRVLRQHHDIGSAYVAGLDRYKEEGASDDAYINAATNLSDALTIAGYWHEAGTILLAASAVANSGDDRRRYAPIRNSLGWLLAMRGDYESASAHLNEARDLGRELGDATVWATASTNLANVHSLLGDHQRAVDLYEEALPVLEQSSDRRRLLLALGNLGIMASIRGEYARAREYQERCLELARKTNDRRAAGWALGNIGTDLSEQGRYLEALPYTLRRLAISEELGDLRAVAITRGVLGTSYFGLGEYSRALEYLTSSQSTYVLIGDRVGVARTWDQIGSVHAELGSFDEARKCYQLELEIAEETDDQEVLGLAHGNLGVLDRISGHESEALEHLSRAIAIHGRLMKVLFLTSWLIELAEIHVDAVASGAGFHTESERERRLVAARESAEEAIRLCGELGNETKLFRALVVAHRCEFHLGNRENTVRELEAMLERSVEEEQRANIHFALREMLSILERKPVAEEHRRIARAAYARLYDATRRYVFRQRLEELDSVE